MAGRGGRASYFGLARRTGSFGQALVAGLAAHPCPAQTAQHTDILASAATDVRDQPHLASMQLAMGAPLLE